MLSGSSLETCILDSFFLPAPDCSPSVNKSQYATDSLDADILLRGSSKHSDRLFEDGKYKKPHWVQENLRRRRSYSSETDLTDDKEEDIKGLGVQILDKQEEARKDLVEAISIVASLKACARSKELHKGSRLHALILDKGLLKKNIFVGNTLINMYAACGALEKAHEVFDELSFRTVVSWNALITGYVHEGLIDKTFECLEKMRMEGFVPNEVTFVCALNACGIAGNIQKGQELHAEIVKYGLLQEATTLGTVLLNMYANCCMLKEAEEVFDNLLTRDVIAWTALIAGYTQHGYANEALNCYDLMQSEGCSPNAFTYSCILKACGSLGALDRGQQIHAKVLQEGLLSGDHVITNSLVDMYAKCGLLDKAHTLFDRLDILDAVSWTALITGYTKYGFAEEALSSFKEMCHKGFPPDAVTFACILKACSIIGAVHQCQEIHVEIIKDGTLLTNKLVYTALVETYASCGMLREAQEVFDSMLTRDVVVWTALMEGYAQLGEVDIVFDLLYKMERDGTKPNMITLTVVLNSCAHNGLLKEGEKFFMMINEGFGALPTLEHHTCMVDLYGRAGHLDKAGAILEEMPYFASPTVWHTLLCACRGNFNRDLGAWAANHACQADMKDPSVYVCLSNMYVISGRHVRKEPYDV